MGKIDFNDYDYIVFVDASGDDGYKFERCSSLCFTTACFITTVSDISVNTEVLNKIKKTGGRKPSDELKYSTLRRHPNYLNALTALTQIQGLIALHNAFKKDLVNDRIVSDSLMKRSKALTAFTHIFPIELIMETAPYNCSRVLICIDRMKKTEMDVVEGLLLNKTKNGAFDIIFMDSKAEGFELIQMADLIAGLSRRFFEDTITCKEAVNFINICTVCHNSIKSKKIKNSCSIPKIAKAKSKLLNKEIKFIYPNILRIDNKIILKGISMFPASKNLNYIFLDCYK